MWSLSTADLGSPCHSLERILAYCSTVIPSNEKLGPGLGGITEAGAVVGASCGAATAVGIVCNRLGEVVTTSTGTAEAIGMTGADAWRKGNPASGGTDGFRGVMDPPA